MIYGWLVVAKPQLAVVIFGIDSIMRFTCL